jgi:ankyrin repeat protein
MELLSIGAQVNAVNEQSISPIHITAGVASEKLLRVVCDAGANIFATDNASQTVIHYLLAFNQTDLSEFVLGCMHLL